MGVAKDSPLARVVHVGPIIRVRDVAASVDWFRDKLGLEATHVGHDGPDAIAVFELAGSSFSLWQLRPQSSTQTGGARSTYLAFVVTDGIESVHDDLRTRGVPVDELRGSKQYRFFWLFDPDGNRYEISQPLTKA